MATTATVRGEARATQLGQRSAVARVEQAIRSAVREPRSTYLQEFAQAFRTLQSTLTETEVLAQVCAADVVLIGDYHTLASCQRFTTSLLSKIATSDSRPTVLGLEAVYSTTQAVLDEWVDGGKRRASMNEDDLRQRLRFTKDWGYDWEPYGELFATARKSCEGIWGLDSEPRFDLRRVRARDRHMAARIGDMRKIHPHARVVAFVGESHLAPEHLPQLVRKVLPGERVLTVLQNVDSLYWQLAEGDSIPPSVAISEDVLCVFNASPLEKYETYREYLERWRD